MFTSPSRPMNSPVIGITGYTGFVGRHLVNTLRLLPEPFQIVTIPDEMLENTVELSKVLAPCHTLVHLAAVNRHSDPQYIYNTNVQLAEKLVAACQLAGTKPHVIFSSSIQELQNNEYGNGKRRAREILEQWAHDEGTRVTTLVIPNVFGPFGKPFYNSVVATFCHQLTQNHEPHIEVDRQIPLVYVGNVVKAILFAIEPTNLANGVQRIELPHDRLIRVSEILEMLQVFRDLYLKQGVFPNLFDPFALNLFNTFLCYVNHSQHFPVPLRLNTDERGAFVETIKTQSGGQVSFSTTVPGITRGNHFHTRKVERFAVISGKARIAIRQIGTGAVHQFDIDGENPAYVDMPIWFTHSITNIGSSDLYTIFWISEPFDPTDPDTFFEAVQ